ncbi:hypothetical protein M758_2G092700 [Ceratodon purpureus]|nr:hypothetical protein M758_2G092700 [Ceratodon purpureus]
MLHPHLLEILSYHYASHVLSCRASHSFGASSKSGGGKVMLRNKSMPSLLHRSSSIVGSLTGRNRHLTSSLSCLGFSHGGVLRTRSVSAAVVVKTGSQGKGGGGGIRMGYWLLKTEPGEWGWEHQERNGGVSHWDGVRNAQAQGNLRSMRMGDHAFFYHSGKGPCVVGVVEVVRAAYPDSSDESGKHCMVDVRALAAFPSAVPLSVIKGDEAMRDWILLRQSRLSVMPVSPAVWARVCELGELSPPLCMTAGEDDAAVAEVKPAEPKRTAKEKKQKASVRDSSEVEEEPKKRARRLPAKARNGVSTDIQEDVKQEVHSTESGVVSVAELKTYQRVSRRKVGIVEVAVVERFRNGRSREA